MSYDLGIDDIRDYILSMQDQLQTCEGILLDIEGSSDSTPSNEGMNEFKRVIHSIKGTSGSYGLRDIQSACHNLEDYLVKVEHKAAKGWVDQLLKYVDLIGKIGSKVLDNDDVSQLNIGQELMSMNFTETSVGHKALIIEPSKLIRKNIIKSLEGLGVSCSICSEPIEGLNRLILEPFDSLITSNRFPNLEGIQLIKMLRAGGIDKQGLHLTLLTSESRDFREDGFSPDRIIIKDGQLRKNLEGIYGQLLDGKDQVEHTYTKIAFIDDDSSMHLLINLSFKNIKGVEHRIYSSLQEFQAAKDDFGPDLIVTDFMLKNENGLDVLKAVQAQQDQTPVAFLTGTSDPAQLKSFSLAGAKAVIEKPIRPSVFYQDLVTKVSKAG
jgi:DNA-binding response OmpR family regulator/HPt (histidine-containing phosphotransfer) domain-containing protein